jgi:hypothetical protein
MGCDIAIPPMLLRALLARPSCPLAFSLPFLELFFRVTHHSVKQVPTWATEKPAPHFGKPSGLASGSWKHSKIMQIISQTRPQQGWERRIRSKSAGKN